MDGFMCRLCVNLTYRQTKAVLVIYPYFTASQYQCTADFKSLRRYSFYLGKTPNRPFLGVFRGGLDLFDV
jgi:hypothetical protein